MRMGDRDRHAAWLLGCVAIQARHGRGKHQDTVQEAVICVAARAEARRHGARGTDRDTVGRALRHCRACATTLPARPVTWPRHGRPQATIRPGTGPRHSRDTAGMGAVRAACVHRLGQGVHLVHPTQF